MEEKKEKSNDSTINRFNVMLEKMDDYEFYKMYCKKEVKKNGKGKHK